MKTEKIILSFIAALIGLLAAGVAFYLYQTTKTISPSQVKTVTVAKPTPTPKSSLFLSIDSPEDEDVTDRKTVTITGKTVIGATIVISTESSDQVVQASATGSFSTTATIDNGVNQIEITAIAPNGEEITIVRTITYSTETF